MQMIPATSWTTRFTGVIGVASAVAIWNPSLPGPECAAPLFVEHLCARIDGARRRHRDADTFAEFYGGADDRLQLQRPSGFEILQHRRLVRTNFFCAGHPLLDRDRQLDPELPGDRLGFGHDFADHGGRVRMADQLLQRPAGECADRVEGDVAEQLHPDLVAEPGRDRHAETAAISASASALMRSLRVPFGSPRLSRLPSVW